MEDDKHLCRAPGIGKKTAGRIILELKDKIKTEEVTQGVDIQEGFEDIIPNNANSVEEALGALLALGYSEKEAENVSNSAKKVTFALRKHVNFKTSDKLWHNTNSKTNKILKLPSRQPSATLRHLS